MTRHSFRVPATRVLSILGLLLMHCLAMRGQGIRIDPNPVMLAETGQTSANIISILAVPNAKVTVCGYPANGVPCTNYATTYTDSTMTTPCPSSGQIVLANTNACAGTTDAWGNFGFWVAPGMYSYTVQSSAGTAGPFFVSTGTDATVWAGQFGIVCDGQTDSTQGFLAMDAYLVAHDNTTVLFPPNATCLTSWKMWLWQVQNVRLIGTNTAVVWTGETNSDNYSFAPGGSDFVCQSWVGAANTVNYASYTASVLKSAVAGSNTVTVKTPSDLTLWQAGDEVLVYGFDQQGYGFPPNYRFYDRTKISSVNVAKGTVTLADPLKWTYNPNWLYWKAASTTPPSIRNMTRGCPNGGNIYPMQHLYVVGFDFSQAPPAASGAQTAALINDIRLAEFNQCKFLNVSPSTSGTVRFTDCTIGDMEIDKLLGSVIVQNSVFTGDSFTTNVLREGTGADLVELDNDEFWGQTALSAKTTHYKNCTWHYINPYGFTQSAFGFWSSNLIVENPTFVANGNPGQAGLLGKNTNSTAKVLSVSGANSFTVSLTDGLAMAELCGPGTIIYSNSTSNQVVGTISDIEFNQNASAVVVVGNFSGLTPNQVISYSVNTIHTQVINPTMTGTGTDIHQWMPVWVGEYNSVYPNLEFDFEQPTTVSDLGPCNLPSTGTTKIVTDAVSSAGGTVVQGGGNLKVGVSCQGTGFGGSWVVR